MHDTTALPKPVGSLADVAALAAGARQLETLCGDGSMVWRIWGDGPATVLLHGGSGSWTHWVRNIAALVDAGRTVCVPDLPGFGDSAVAGRDADAAPPWLEQGLRALIGDARCDVVGFSFGAMVGCLLAQRYPHRVRALVLVGAPALAADALPPLKLRAWADVPEGPQREAAHRHNLKRLMLARDESIDELALALHAANVVRDRMPRRRLSRTDLVVRALPQIEARVSGIWGAADALYRDRTEMIDGALRQARTFGSLTLIPRAGHWVQYENAHAFDDALCSVLAAGAQT